jgi:hypothetical protein
MLLRLLDRFFEKNPILIAAFIGVHPRDLEEPEHQDGPQ